MVAFSRKSKAEGRFRPGPGGPEAQCSAHSADPGYVPGKISDKLWSTVVGCLNSSQAGFRKGPGHIPEAFRRHLGRGLAWELRAACCYKPLAHVFEVLEDARMPKVYSN